MQKGIAPKSAVAIVFSGPFQYDDDHILALRTMALILQSRLLDTIRQELGGTYSITVDPTFQKFADAALHRSGSNGRAIPARTTALVQRVFDEIDFVRTTALRQEGMASLRQTVKRELDDQQQNNGYWLGQIARRYQDGGGGDIAAIDRACRSDRRALDRRDSPRGRRVSRYVAVREGDADARGQVAARHAKDAHLVDEDERVTRSIGRSSRSPHSFHEPV